MKDMMRKAGDVAFTAVDRTGGAVADFKKKDDMYYAVDKLDDTEFKNRYDKAYVR